MDTKNRRIIITLPENVLKAVDWLAPLEDMTRDELITKAVKRFLKPHLEIRAQVLKADTRPGKTYGPFNTAQEMIADLKGRLNKRAVLKKKEPPFSMKSLVRFKTTHLQRPKNRRRFSARPPKLPFLS